MTYNFLRFYGPPVAALYTGTPVGGGGEVGGAALLTGEANGFAVDFTHTTDAERVAIKETLGPELLTNGGFDSGASWTPDADWTISGGVATKVAGAGTAVLVQTVSAMTIGRAYRVVYTVTITAGSIYAQLGAVVAGTSRTTSGTYSEQLTATAAHTTFRFVGGAAAACSIDNVSLMEVASVGTTTTTSYGVDTFFTSAGTSPKQIYDSTGTLVWSPHNMCLQSEDFAATWTQTSTPVVTAHTLEDNNAAAQSAVSQNVTLVVGATYTYTTWILKDAVTSRFPSFMVSGTGQLTVNLNTSTGAITNTSATFAVGSSAVTDTGTHWQLKLTFVAELASTAFRIYPAWAGTFGVASNSAVGTITVDKVQINRGPVPTAYLTTTTAARNGLAVSHDPTTLAATGLFVEVAATNLLLRSTEFDNASWVKTRVTANANAIAAPNGLTQADAIVPNAETNTFSVSQNITSVAATTYTFSCFVKDGSIATHWLELTIISTTTWKGWFDLASGVKGTSSGSPISYTITSVGNGWYRVDLTVTAGTTTAGCYLSPRPADGVSTSVIGDGVTPAFYAWGAQMETGTIATSQIPTFTASATRAVDNVSFLLTAIPSIATEYSMYGRFSAPIAANSQYALCLSDGTAGNISTLRLTDAARLTVYVGGAPQAIIPAASIAADVVASVAGRCKQNDFAVSQDGAAVGTDVSGTLPAVTKFAFGGVGATGAAFRIRHAVIVPRVWNDAELVTRSTP